MAYGLVVLAAVTFVLAAVAVAAHDPEADTSAGGGDAAATTAPATTTTTATAPPTSAAPPTTAGAEPSPGAADVGDPYIPGIGNGGYDVRHYDLGLTVAPDTGRIDGDVTVEAVATQALSSFDLDLLGMEVAAVAVDGRPAEVERTGERELVVTPAAAIPAGATFEARITYGGVPEMRPERNGILVPGWTADGTGESALIGEPDGASTVFPVQRPPDRQGHLRHPGHGAGGHRRGRQRPPHGDPARRGRAPRPGRSRRATPWRPTSCRWPSGTWSSPRRPARTGCGSATRSTPTSTRAALAPVERIPEMIDLFDDRFGPYPFEAYGVVVVDEALGVALENQTLSLFGVDSLERGHDGARAGAPVVRRRRGPGHLAGHLAQRGLRHLRPVAVARRLRRLDRRRPGPGGRQPATAASTRRPADPGADNLFGVTVYRRGALTLHVLRHEVGDDAFFRILRTWVDRYGGRTATTADFEALAAERLRPGPRRPVRRLAPPAGAPRPRRLARATPGPLRPTATGAPSSPGSAAMLREPWRSGGTSGTPTRRGQAHAVPRPN